MSNRDAINNLVAFHKTYVLCRDQLWQEGLEVIRNHLSNDIVYNITERNGFESVNIRYVILISDQCKESVISIFEDGIISPRFFHHLLDLLAHYALASL